MIKSTSWDVYKSLSQDCEELIQAGFQSREEAEEEALRLSEEHLGDYFLVYGNMASSPCWMSW